MRFFWYFSLLLSFVYIEVLIFQKKYIFYRTFHIFFNHIFLFYVKIFIHFNCPFRSAFGQ
jgi:hypothetical protein